MITKTHKGSPKYRVGDMYPSLEPTSRGNKRVKYRKILMIFKELYTHSYKLED